MGQKKNALIVICQIALTVWETIKLSARHDRDIQMAKFNNMGVLALSGGKWLQSEVEYVRYCAENGIRYETCAKKLNRPVSSVYYVKWKLGLSNSCKWTQAEENKLKKALENNIDLIECAKMLKKSISNVRQKVKKLGLKITGRKRWKQNEIDYLRYCVQNDVKWSFCATKLGKGLTTIYKKAHELGLETKKRRVWTQEQKENLKKELQAKMSLEECANKLGRNIYEIKRQAKIFGFLPKKPRGKRWLETEDKKLKKYLLDGLSLAECAKKLNRTAGAIKMRAYYLGYPIVSNLRKWTDKEKEYMRYCADNGISWLECAKKLNRPLSTVRSMASYYKIRQKSRKKLGLNVIRKKNSFDDEQKINMCLNCTLPDCTNCLGRGN